MAWARDFLGSGAGRWAGVGFTALAAVALLLALNGSFGDSEAAASSRDRIFVCAKTGKPFRHEAAPGDVTPVPSPHSGARTGYPAELCYWTPDGVVKAEPTAVLLKSYLDQSGPTFCPECDRLVVGHNPRPEPGDVPPPLRDQYKPSKKESQDER